MVELESEWTAFLEQAARRAKRDAKRAADAQKALDRDSERQPEAAPGHPATNGAADKELLRRIARERGMMR
jgi:hypothetical protein